MKFEHLDISSKDIKKYDIKKLKKTSVWFILKKVCKQNMKNYHSSLTPNKVYELMQNRCILFSSKEYDLILGKRFNRMLRIYRKKNSDAPDFWIIPEFDFIKRMFFRNQVSEC